MVFCLAKSFVPRVLIDFEIFQYQFAPNCIRRRGRDEAPPCVGGDHLCARPRYIYSSRIQGRRNGRPSRILSPPPPPLSLPRGGKSPAASLFLLLLLPLLPPLRFLSSRFIFRALIASSLCLPFSYWRHVILLLPLPLSLPLPLPPPGFRRFRHRRFF